MRCVYQCVSRERRSLEVREARPGEGEGGREAGRAGAEGWRGTGGRGGL